MWTALRSEHASTSMQERAHLTPRASASTTGLQVPERHVVKLEGFTTRMHDYLMSTDLIVSKPGGLTTAESMATGTPMVIVNPIPGQETRNTDMLLEAGAAIKINDLPLLACVAAVVPSSSVCCVSPGGVAGQPLHHSHL